MIKGARKMHRINCIKFLIISALIQALLLTFYLATLIDGLRPIEEAKHVTVIVDEFEVRKTLGHRHINTNYYIHAGSTEYEISTSALVIPISEETIKPGDKLSLMYFEDHGLRVGGGSNYVIDIRSDTEVISTAQEYLDGRPIKAVGWSVLMGFLELIFLCIVVVYFIAHKKDFKELFSRRKRKKAKQKSDSQ